MSGTSPPQLYNIGTISDKQGRDDIEKSLVRLFCLLDLINKRFHYQLSAAEHMQIQELLYETRNTYLDYVLETI